MYGGRLLGIPWYAYKGGRRVLALGQKRQIYCPQYQVDREYAGDTIIESYRPFPYNEICPPKQVHYVRSLPHQEPPQSGARITYVKETVIVPPGTVVGFDGGIFRPGIWENPALYTIPWGYRYELKKFLIIPLDTSYDTLFTAILHNEYEAFHVQGPNRLPADPLTAFHGGGWELLPNFPQDQFNTELRMAEGDRLGLKIINNTPFEREVHIAAWGWKYPEKCEHYHIGVR